MQQVVVNPFINHCELAKKALTNCGTRKKIVHKILQQRGTTYSIQM